ncbi:MAG: NAD(P)/FAD-dependent oxidoreductase [Myxococcales bacterium]|nr:NAD(P)/FAD-dependent oxidoreductase [Myxococcales bacterium]MDP3502543.1 NAD(P)/FAD-dependent oxidoreductase [Myxococcales bacterium]
MAHRVVIVGGGFGGLEAARRLAKSDVQVTVVDRQNYHLFQPLLYQVATAGLSPADIASPIRHLVASAPHVEVRMAEVTSVDLAQKRVTLSNGELAFDSLILAAGVRHSYFGKPEWEGDAPGLKTLDDALEIRRRVLLAFENAERTDDERARAAWLTFVVVGAGPTGVELAGAISELARFTVARDFRRFDPRSARVVLVEAGDRVLSAFHPALSQKAYVSLQEHHVDVKLNTRVLDVNSDGVQLPDAFLPSRTVLWAAGVEAPALSRTLGVELDRSGRIKVNPDLSVPGHPDVYVIGDLAYFPLPDGSSLPGLAPVALQQGRRAAKNIEAAVSGQPKKPFKYVDKGIMATVGRASGIAQAGALRLSGMIGWLAWLFIHVLYLIGFRNRLLVMLQWAWAWVTYGRGARLITGTTPVPESTPALPMATVPAREATKV